jgi:ferric-dicitrate binding protein FerR (iron transport regulator)
MAKKFSTEEAQHLLKRYREGRCTKKELEIINRWYQSFDQNEADQDSMSPVDIDRLKRQMFQSVNNKIDLVERTAEISDDRKSLSGNRLFSTFKIISRIAAVLVVTIALAFFFYERTPDVGSQLRSSATPRRGENLATRTMKASQPSTVYLSDGSVVWLKEGSTLEYPETFSRNSRSVNLTGEAFFDVARNPEKPFVIHSGNFTTRVLGTTFNIKAYRNDASAEVVVVTGKVVVSVKEPASDKVSELVLHPNRKAVYSRINHSLVESAAAENSTDIALDKRKLAFEETSLEDIIKVLNATYGIRISVSVERMNHCIVTADLTNEPLEVGLAILSKALNATYTVNGNNIELLGRGCGVQP